ncbi:MULTISPECIES: glycosyltransferase family 2 protein [unclassified Thioalkalivibrio]|uniref:glycosyltransferase family 2 protein n=1 Tax=unclassified Thioalkalivibrio TaxID=2621013 RepID=UPI00035F4ED7|nr:MULTISPECIES: glycosyltransferase family 2 protein [unclassified Thioalkalivibrio]
MTNHRRIEVLLSAFNGERYIAEQIESIRLQTAGNVVLRIRDDGSTDSTLWLLNDLARAHDWIKVERGENVGASESFFRLLETASSDTAFAAFCDQDDWWHPDKLERAIKRLSELPTDVPALYFSAIRRVSHAGVPLQQIPQDRYRPGLANALVQNIAQGCTMVLNRAAIDLLNAARPDMKHVAMHDWWAYLVISACGQVIHDPVPTLDYRQHRDNLVGAKTGTKAWVDRIARFRARGKTPLVRQAQELLDTHSQNMPTSNRRLCEEFVARAGSSRMLERLKYALRTPVYRQSCRDNRIMKILMILGWR